MWFDNEDDHPDMLTDFGFYTLIAVGVAGIVGMILYMIH